MTSFIDSLHRLTVEQTALIEKEAFERREQLHREAMALMDAIQARNLLQRSEQEAYEQAMNKRAETLNQAWLGAGLLSAAGVFVEDRIDSWPIYERKGLLRRKEVFKQRSGRPAIEGWSMYAFGDLDEAQVDRPRRANIAATGKNGSYEVLFMNRLFETHRVDSATLSLSPEGRINLVEEVRGLSEQAQAKLSKLPVKTNIYRSGHIQVRVLGGGDGMGHATRTAKEMLDDEEYYTVDHLVSPITLDLGSSSESRSIALFENESRKVVGVSLAEQLIFGDEVNIGIILDEMDALRSDPEYPVPLVDLDDKLSTMIARTLAKNGLHVVDENQGKQPF